MKKNFLSIHCLDVDLKGVTPYKTLKEKSTNKKSLQQ